MKPRAAASRKRPEPSASTLEIRGHLSRILRAHNDTSPERALADAMAAVVIVGEAVLAAEKLTAFATIKGAEQGTKDDTIKVLQSLCAWGSQGIAELGGASNRAAVRPAQAARPITPTASVTSKDFGRMSDRERRDFLASGGVIATSYTTNLRRP